MKGSRRLTVAMCVSATALSGCYVLPVGPEGQPWHVLPPGAPPNARPLGGAGAAMPVVLTARLYPANESATASGVLTGTVANMMNGKGRFQLNYVGETLTGEATRVDGDTRRGVASAYGPSGVFMSCEYQMSSPRQGAGTCTFSNGARYQAHIGT